MFEVVFISKGADKDVTYSIKANSADEAWDKAEIKFILNGHLYSRYEVEPRIRELECKE